MAILNGKAHGYFDGKTAYKEGGEPPSVLALSVARIDVGDVMVARILSSDYRGCMTHYVKGRSEYCAGAKCRYPCDKLKIFWKGYCAVEYWSKAKKLWRPIVLELTEHCELDVRGIFARGQVWEFFRLNEDEKGKQQPVQARLMPPQQFRRLPAEFEYLPAVKNLYHEFALVLDKKNPLPPRVIVEDSEDDGPAFLQQLEELRPREDPEEVRKREEAFRKSMGSPTANGSRQPK